MKIAEYRDTESIQALRPAAQRERAIHNLGTVGLEDNGINAKSGDARRRGKTQKIPPGSARRQWNLGTWFAGLIGNGSHSLG